MAHPLRDHLDVAAGRDHQRGTRVAEVVEGQLGDARMAGGGLEDPAVEVVRVERAALGRGEEVAVGVGRSSELLLAEKCERARPDVDRATASARLRLDVLAVLALRKDRKRSGLEVDIAVTQSK